MGTLRFVNEMPIKKYTTQIQKQILNASERVKEVQRPLFIEFSGTPRSGKSTIIGQVEHFLKRNGLSVKVVEERAEQVDHISKIHPNFTIYTGFHLINYLTQLEKSDYNVVLIDRGIFDTLCWLNWHVLNLRLERKEQEALSQVFLLKRWQVFMDQVFIFTVDPKIAQKRELADKLIKKNGMVVNEASLDLFNKAVAKTYKNYKSKFNCTQVKVEENQQKQAAEKLIKIILDELNCRLDEKVLVFPKQGLTKLKIKQGVYTKKRKFNDLVNYMKKYGRLMRREDAEKNFDLIQPISITSVKYKDSYLLLHRENFKNQKDRLRHKDLLWIGGHVRPKDTQSKNILRNCVKREISEELFLQNEKILTSLKPQALVYFTPKSDKKSHTHLAIFNTLEVSQKDIIPSLINKKFEESKGKYTECRFINKNDIKKCPKKLDNWSKMIVEKDLI